MAYRRINDLNFLTDDEHDTLCNTFEDRFDRRGPDECWPWFNGKGKHGRGQMTLGGQTVPAPRVAYLLYVGDIPDHDSHHGNVVRHTCDNPPCVNPKHLIIGTQKDNLRDRDERGRAQHGEKHSKARITEEIVLAIRRDLRATGAIAAAFGVTVSMVCNIKSYRTWSHLPPTSEDVPIPKQRPVAERPKNWGKKRGRKRSTVPDEVRAEILQSTEFIRVLADKHGISRTLVWAVRNGKR